MNLALGIDTGGTYTDAVLVDHDTGQVLAGAKALTTRHDLAIGIRAAIAEVFAEAQRAGRPLAPNQVTLVALSTTLATNTLAEGQRGSVCLLLIGYDRALMQDFGFEKELATSDVVYLRGGHNERGDEAAPLDEEAARAAILARRNQVEAFAISGYFSVRNPSHELRVRALVEELTGLPVTCGHELSSRLNAVRRATTATLNAHLILPLRELISSVQQTLEEWQISAPLMVVKGDGSLVRAAWAMQRPVETILSGPAASAIGARHLAGQRDVWVVDVGGTTTDIIALHDGWPRLNPQGASVSGWRTMVEAVDVHTSGLGGDSYVYFDEGHRLQIGPRRVVPLALLAWQYPQVLAEMRQRALAGPRKQPPPPLEFLLLARRPGYQVGLAEEEILGRLAAGPLPLEALLPRRGASLLRRRLNELEACGLIRRSAFTPTDALHALGRLSLWDAEAATLGAQALAAQAGLPVQALCEEVVQGVANRVATELVSKAFEDEIGPFSWEREPLAHFMLANALNGRHGQETGEVCCQLTLCRPIVAIGAPVGAYLPQVAQHLHTELLIPPHAEVANAVGAVVGGVLQRRQVLIRPLDDAGLVRLHLPNGVHDCAGLEAAVGYARELMIPYMVALAQEAGADQVEVQMQRQDHWAPTAHGGEEQLYLGTDLIFVAAGRPRVNCCPPACLPSEPG